MPIKTILFDLDDTLYPTQCGVWSAIREKINSYMIERLQYADGDVASARENLFRQYGTTLRGLQAVHNIDSRDYLDYVHNVPIESMIFPNAELNLLLGAIPQRKVIFTNADRIHANRVLSSLQIEQHFEQIIDVIDVDPYCKPMPESFTIALRLLSISDPASVLLIDDSAANVSTARSMGIKTVRVNQKAQDYNTSDLEIKNIEEFKEIMMEILEI